jgi:FkbM family methyltransferase
MGIKGVIKKAVIKLTPQRIKSFIWDSDNQKIEHRDLLYLSFSQEGEDLVLQRLFHAKFDGFYVDIGAHHPFRYSNTYKFYLKGWSGINIDPLPGSMEKFKKSRIRDINLEIPILNNPEKEMIYYMFNEPAFNTFNEKNALAVEKDKRAIIINKLNIKPYRLEEILEKYLPPNVIIDFLSVDVEGMDLEVLKSNNWEKFRPQYIVAESFNTNLNDDFDSELSVFLKENGYMIVSKTVNSLIFSNNKNS